MESPADDLLAPVALLTHIRKKALQETVSESQRLVHCRSGRKKAALLYVLTYTSGCVTKHFNDFNVLFVGRVFSGVATSLLYSAFESWLVAEHKKVGFQQATSRLTPTVLCPLHCNERTVCVDMG